MTSDVRISVLDTVPAGGRGFVRDLRVRWALEEAGIPYAVEKLGFMAERSPEYLAEQPFGQVPAYREGDVTLFESGAIVLHIGEKSEALLPRDPRGRGRAISWLFAALNSIEPEIWNFMMVGLLYPDQPWREEARAIRRKQAQWRLRPLADHLGDREWLEGRFTMGDLMLVSVLRALRDSDLLAEFPTLAAYRARGEARPAFQRALAAQLADFEDQPAAA